MLFCWPPVVPLALASNWWALFFLQQRPPCQMTLPQRCPEWRKDNHGWWSCCSVVRVLLIHWYWWTLSKSRTKVTLLVRRNDIQMFECLFYAKQFYLIDYCHFVNTLNSPNAVTGGEWKTIKCTLNHGSLCWQLATVLVKLHISIAFWKMSIFTGLFAFAVLSKGNMVYLRLILK